MASPVQSPDQTIPILMRMAPLESVPLTDRKEIPQLFDRVVIRGSLKPSLEHHYNKERIIKPYHNASQHKMRLCFHGDRKVEFSPEEERKIPLRPIDLACSPAVEYVSAEFYQTVVSLGELEENPRGFLTLCLDFLKFTQVEFALYEDDFHLIINMEKEEGKIVIPQAFKFARQQNVNLIAFKENHYILAKFKDGTSKLYRDFLEEDPRKIEEVVFKFLDLENREKTVVLKAP